MGKVQHISQSIELYRSIESFLKETSIDSIDNNSHPSQAREVAIAERLLGKLKEPRSWKFYLKCAYHLTEDQIWSAVEMATRPQIKNHNRYFVAICNNLMHS